MKPLKIKCGSQRTHLAASKETLISCRQQAEKYLISNYLIMSGGAPR